MKIFVRFTSGEIESRIVESDAPVVETLKKICVDLQDPHPERLAFFIGSRRVRKDDQFKKYGESIVPIFEVTHLWRGLSITEDDDDPGPTVGADNVDCKK
ncbi:hypothetical protein FBUS_05375 [Fasciolopsis buskii]|uniref:Ubiquitin-like domain-containing protein n=1 Tax=Fasciolopsis buskii TaxID=27845 RepID=A0A8E0VNP4_9TREM|nr:hypothetical protein FBUS_05375 [Fasciolopsis buski]